MVLVPVPMQTSGTTVTVISQKGFGKKKQKVVTTQVRSDGRMQKKNSNFISKLFFEMN